VQPDPRFHHEHSWMFATHLVLSQLNAITQARSDLPTVVLVCGCGAVWHKVIPPMTEEPPK
jgi:hypothetical protein